MSRLDEILAAHVAQALRPFHSPAQRSLKLHFNVERRRHSLDFAFVLSGRMPTDLESLVVPEPHEVLMRRRRDELWKNTCFEIFVGSAENPAYLEMNLSPSGDWNVYAFAKYRSQMRPVSDSQPPLIKVERVASGDTYEWHGSLRPTDVVGGEGELGELLRSPGLVLGATAVLEYKSGEREYWALAHAGGQPDFHLRESFRLPL